MKKEIFDFLDSKKKEPDEELKAKYERIMHYFKNGYFKDTDDLFTKTSEEIYTILLIASNPFKKEKIEAFLKKYPKFLKKWIFGDSLFGVACFVNSPKINKIMYRCVSEDTITCVEATKKLKEEFIRLNLNTRKIAPFFIFSRKNPSSLREINELFHGLTIKSYIAAANLIKARKKYNGRNDYSQFILNSFLKQFESQLNDLYNIAIKWYERKEKERSRYNRKIDRIKEMLDTKEEIREIDEILRLCPNNEIKERVVDYILAHNKEIYVALTNEYEKAKQNSDENLSLLFARFGFNYDLLNNEDEIALKEMSYEEIENLLSRLKTLSIGDINIGKVCVYKLSIIEDLIIKGTLSTTWIRANHDLLYKGNNELDLALNNLDIIAKEGINILQYQHNQDIIRSSFLTINLNILNIYGLKITKNTTSIAFLQATDLSKRIEFLISLGLYSALTSSLDLLNYSLHECYKLKVAKALNIPLSLITDNYDEVLYDYAATIIPNEIKNLLASELDIESSIPSLLENFQVNSQILNINGVLVSAEKVKRNLGKIGSYDIESCFYAIIYESYYTLEEIENIRQALTQNREAPGIVRR